MNEDEIQEEDIKSTGDLLLREVEITKPEIHIRLTTNERKEDMDFLLKRAMNLLDDIIKQ